MAENASVEMKTTLGLAGLTMNALALIAPGAFQRLTFYLQAATAKPAETSVAIWAS